MEAITGMAVDPLQATYFGSTLVQWTLYLIILALGFMAGKVVNYVYATHIQHRAAASRTQFDDVILATLGKPVTFLLFAVAANVAQPVLSPTEGAAGIIGNATSALMYLAAAWMLLRFTDQMIITYAKKLSGSTSSKLDDQLVPLINKLAKIIISALTLIVILDSFGYNVNAVIASLGIGGLAVAFAAKETIADMFGGFNILTARPFVVGDAVEINGTSGKVEEIGLRYTRIRDYDGRRITMPNSDVAKAMVKNVSSEPTRRVDMLIGLTYETASDELQNAIQVTKDVINGVEGIDTEETAVWFWEYGDSAMQLKVKYFITDLENKFDIRSEVNQRIQEAYEDNGFDMAYPTQTIHVVNDEQ